MKALSILLASGLLLFGCDSLKPQPASAPNPVPLSVPAPKPAILNVIANPHVPVTSLTQDELSDIYLLITNTWDNGSKIIPVNRETGSNARSVFSARVLRQQPSSLGAYWDKLRYKGLTPPLVQESDHAVLAFVQKVPGAIGYVSASMDLKNVKILAEIR